MTESASLAQGGSTVAGMSLPVMNNREQEEEDPAAPANNHPPSGRANTNRTTEASTSSTRLPVMWERSNNNHHHDNNDDGMESTLDEPLMVVVHPDPDHDDHDTLDNHHHHHHHPHHHIPSYLQHPGLQNVPHYTWRRELCACGHLCGTAACVTALCCPLIALAQVMVRVGLNWRGRPQQGYNRTARNAALVATLTLYGLVLAVWLILGLVMEPYDEFDTEGAPVAFVVLVPAALAYYLYFWCLLMQTRRYMRRLYHIIGDETSPCDDCVLACCCPSCNVLQLADHSADLVTYRSYCCSVTGLSRVPLSSSSSVHPNHNRMEDRGDQWVV